MITKLYETPVVGWDESGQQLIVYQFEVEEDYEMFNELSHNEQLEYLGIDPLENHYEPPAGYLYHRYWVSIHDHFILVDHTVAYNV